MEPVFIFLMKKIAIRSGGDAGATAGWHSGWCKKSTFPRLADKAAKGNPDVPAAPERPEIFPEPEDRKHVPYFRSLPGRSDGARLKIFQKRSRFSSPRGSLGKLHAFPGWELYRRSLYRFLRKLLSPPFSQAAPTMNRVNLLPIARNRDGLPARSIIHRALSCKSRQEPIGEFYK